jgi:hypothetical protein
MKSLKLVSLVLAVLLTLTLVVSCSNNEEENSKPAGESNTEQPSGEDSVPAESSEEVSRGPLDHLDDLALNGLTITFLVENGALGYPSVEIMPNEENGAEIASSVLERNNLVEEKLGCTIAERRTDNMASELRSAALDVPDFDIACPYMTTGAPLIMEDLFLDLYQFDDIINFKAPYWDQNADADLSFGDKLYMTTGDFSLLTMDVTHCMSFNKNGLNNNRLESPYELVENGEWTMDKMLEMARTVTQDTDGVDGLSYKDTIGLFINWNYSNSLYIGSGEKFVVKNADGVPQLAFAGERQVDVTKKIFDIFHDDKVIYDEGFNAQAIADGFKNCYWAARDRLGNDGALFVTISLSDVLNLADYDCNFGMLITPKYTKDQDRYYSYISVIKATGCVIPVSNPEPENAAILLEAMNAASTATVKFDYYERIFKLQKARDQEDSDMLDRIFASRVYDIGSIFNWGGARDFIANVANGSSFDYMSSLESAQGKMETEMQDTVDYFSN